MTRIILIFTGVSVREKRRYRGFSGLGLHFFFPSGYLGNRNFWVGFGQSQQHSSTILRPIVYFSGIFFLSSTKSRFHRDSAFDWRYWFTESTILLGVRGQLSAKKKIKERESLSAFSYRPSGRPDINNATYLVSPSATSMRSD